MNEIYLVILWPPALKIADKMSLEISKHYTIFSSISYSMDKDNFKKFMFKIYKPDKTPTSRIKRKYKAMRVHGTNVRILGLEIPDPTMLPHKKARLKGMLYCQEMKRLKRKIRSIFKSKVKGYVHDIIMHVSDNEDHNRRTRKLLKKYAT